MARPNNKIELIDLANKKYEDMIQLIQTITEQEQTKNFNFDEMTIGKEAHWKRDKNIKDVLIHLYEWHMLLINCVEANKKGIEKQFLIEGYNWKTYGDMNIEFWKKHQNTTYENAKIILKESHCKVIKLIETFSNEELFSKGVINWTGGSTLGSYCISVTSSHYDWAIKKIKKYIKEIK